MPGQAKLSCPPQRHKCEFVRKILLISKILAGQGAHTSFASTRILPAREEICPALFHAQSEEALRRDGGRISDRSGVSVAGKRLQGLPDGVLQRVGKLDRISFPNNRRESEGEIRSVL